MSAYETTTVASEAALDTWISDNPNAIIHSVVSHGGNILILFTVPDLPTTTYRDRVGTEAVTNKV